MTERERLLKIIKDISSCKNNSCLNCCAEKECYIQQIATALLENGVTVLPCKVGDDVYVIEECRCYNTFFAERCRERQETCNSKKYIKAVEIPAKTGTKCLKLFKRPFKLEWVSKIGKSVFLNYDEAVAKAKEGEGND